MDHEQVAILAVYPTLREYDGAHLVTTIAQ